VAGEKCISHPSYNCICISYSVVDQSIALKLGGNYPTLHLEYYDDKNID